MKSQLPPNASRRGTNLTMAADFNQSVILDAIRRSRGGASRVELGKATGLSTQTVSNICRKLIDDQLIQESGKLGDGPGKPRTILTLEPSGNFAVGVHIDPAIITLVILDFAGKVISRVQFDTPAVTSPKTVIKKISSAINRLIDKSGVDKTRILGMGIASPGPIDQTLGVVVDPPNLLGWHRVPLRDELADATGLAVILDKDVTAAAVGEIWNGDFGPDEDFLFFYTGVGVGVGLVLGGEVFRGSTTNAGEIGGLIVDSNASTSKSQRFSTVSQLIHPLAILKQAELRGVLKLNRLGYDAHSVDLQFNELAKLCKAGDLVARDVVTRSAIQSAKAISGIMSLLDVTTVVFGGPFWSRLQSIYLEVVPKELENLRIIDDPRPIRVVPSTIGIDVAAVGAACLVLDQAFSPKPGNLVFDPPKGSA